MDLDFVRNLKKSNNTKIVLLVLDGLGGLTINNGGLTELEKAVTPNLDKLALESVCGLQIPVGNGITPGSGPGHLALFGYNPIKYQVGRGVLAANGIGFKLENGDIAARGNFATVNEEGLVVDRRAGRISSEKNNELCKKLCNNINLDNCSLFIETVKEHRFLLVLRAEGLSSDIIDTDPQEVGKKPFKAQGFSDKSDRTVDIVNDFLNQTSDLLRDEKPANMVLLRGFSKKPDWPLFRDVFGLKSAAIASYPMYKGLAGLIGMDLLESEGDSIQDEINTLKKYWGDYDFFFIHVKKTDSYGEDGNFDAKVKVIEEVDQKLSQILDLNPDVLIVTGDHSTPSALKYHSWHPVPVLVYSKFCRPDKVSKFGERDCITGGLGPRFPAEDLIPLALANSKRLEKFGA